MSQRFRFSQICIAVALILLFLAPVQAQTVVRFDTNVGNIDFQLNPTNDPNLQPHVENILAYVNSGRYDFSVINRAADGNPDDPSDDFVLQFGGFTLESLVLPDSFADFINIPSFDPVIVDQDGDGNVDFDFSAVSNTRGTVSLALSAGNPNSGTSSFFINLGDNGALLDPQGFVPFAEVVDLSTVDLILSLPQRDFAGGSLAGDDVPVVNGTGVVFIERAFVLEAEGSTTAITYSRLSNPDAFDPAATIQSTFSNLTSSEDAARSDDPFPVTFSNVGVDDSTGGSAPFTFSTLTPNPDATGSAAASASLAAPTAAPVVSAAVAVPEPPALVLAIGALMMIYIMKPSRN